MGVAGLWEVLRPAGQVRSLTELAVEDGFNTNPSRQRGFRIGIDASIWFFHAAYGREGENPELRTLFFRCSRLLQSPLLPLFVFDGPKRPAIKRGKRVGGNVHWLTQGMKNIIDAFGFEWRVAPGEAEAELAYLSRIGIIDAVLSDDVDNFLFGATMVIRNPSNTLSGNRAHPVKNAQGKDDGNHVVTYTAHAILSDPAIALSRAGVILIGLLSGGDYIPAGLPGCGQKFATGLARAGFGDSLVKAVEELKGAQLEAFLVQWRQDLKNELKTNKSGLLPSKKPSLAASLPDDFPSLPVLMSYADPLTSENTPQKGNLKHAPCVWRNDPDPKQIASLCELYFEWGVKDVIVQRFRTVLWPGIACRALRRAVIDEDTRRPPPLDTYHLDSRKASNNSLPASPTKQLSSTLSALTLSSPPKKSSALGASTADQFIPESFTLSSLVHLTSSASSRTSRCASPSSPALRTSSSPPLLLEVLSQRTHASTDSILEYRVLVDPTTLVERAESGVKGLRPPLVGGLFGIDTEDENDDQDEDASGSDIDRAGIERLETTAAAAAKSGTKRRKMRREVPTAPLRLWLPACMIQAAAPALAEAYEEKVRVREEKKAKRGTRGGRGGRTGTRVKSASRTKVKGVANGSGDESVPGPSTSKTAAGPKATAKAVGVSGKRRKPKQASEAQDDAYEFIDLSASASACSSDGEGVGENTKGKGKPRPQVRRIEIAKTTIKANSDTKPTSNKLMTANTMQEFFKATRPSTTRTTKSKPSTWSPPMDRASTLDTIVSKRIHEDEENLADVAVPPSLSKSTRPLDLLRAKSKRTAPLDSASKSRSAIPRYEEEESSPTPYPPLSGPRAAPHAKKPLFVDVSDSDSDIEVSGVRHPFSGMTATTIVDEGMGNVSISVGVNKTLTHLGLQKGLGSTVNGVDNPMVRGDTSMSKNISSMSTLAGLIPPKCPASASLGLDTNTKVVPVGARTGISEPTVASRSPSKLAHILLSALSLDSEEAAGSGDQLPTFHWDSSKSENGKTSTTTTRPAPRPFPMQSAFQSHRYPHASRPIPWGGSRHSGPDKDNEVEIGDVFTTPQRPSPPRSPTPTPSPLEAPPDNASVASPTFMNLTQSSGFPTSPTEAKSGTDTEPRTKTKQRHPASSDRDTPMSGNERDRIRKSPRKSEVHSSPWHVARVRGRAASPTPPTLSRSASRAHDVLRPRASDGCQPAEEKTGSAYPAGGVVVRKPRPSDASAIYISSGSEDEGGAEAGINHGRSDGEAGTDEDDGADAGGWADKGMILSCPPSPARSRSPPLVSDPGPVVEAVPARPARASRFKPATAAASNKGVRAPSVERQGTAKATPEGTANGGDTVAPRPVRRAPLLVARAKGSTTRAYVDVIDLTSD